MERARNLGEKIIRWALVGLGVAVFSFLAVCSLLFMAYYPRETYAETVVYRQQSPLLGLLITGAFVAVLCLLFWLLRKWKPDVGKVHRLGFAVVVLAGLFWVLLTRCVPNGEPENLIACAEGFMRGDYSAFLPGGDVAGGYLYLFPFQLGYTALLQAVYTVFGVGNHLVLYLLHVACLGAVYTLCVRITRLMFKDEHATFVAILLMLGCLYLVAFTTFLYPILLGLTLSLLAVLCIYRFWDDPQHGLRFLLLGAAAMALALVFKSNFAIFAVGLGLVLLVDFLKQPNRYIPIALAAFLVFSFGMKTALFSYYEARSGLEIGDGVPSIVWTAMGLADDSYMAPGWYNGDSYSVYPGNGYDQQATKHAARDSIEQSLARMGRDGSGPSFFYWKTVSQWNEPTMGCFLPSHYLDAALYQDMDHARSELAINVFYGEVHEALVFVMDKVHMLVYIGALLCLVLQIKRLSIRQMLPFVILLGGFLFHTFFWEAKSQYIAIYFVLAIPYAAAGYAQLAEWLLDKLPDKLRAIKKPQP